MNIKIITELLNENYITRIPPKKHYKNVLDIKNIRKAYPKTLND